MRTLNRTGWRFSMRVHHVCLLAVLLISAARVSAQESRGTIVGVVADPSGAAIVGAQVKAVNVATNAGANSVTNERGAYEIPYLLPGVYRITIESQGFKKAARDGIELRVADRMLLDFKLEVGDVAESVTVRSEEHTSELQSPKDLVCRLLLE